MSDQPEPEKSADPNAQHPSQPPAYQTEPPQGQYPLPDQKYPPTAQYPSQEQYPPLDQYPSPGQYPPQGQYPPLGQYPPSGQQYPPTALYNQQQASVTMVTAQPVATRRVHIANQRPAPDYRSLTIVGMLVCCLCGGVLGIFFVPALVCSIMASSANSSRDYDTAKKLGRASLLWNIGVYIFNTLAIIAIVVAVIVLQSNTRCSINRFGRTVCF